MHNESTLSSTSSSNNLQKSTPIGINANSTGTASTGASLTNNSGSNNISSNAAAAAALAAVLQQRDISALGGTNVSITAANNSSIAINALQNSITHQVCIIK